MSNRLIAIKGALQEKDKAVSTILETVDRSDPNSYFAKLDEAFALETNASRVAAFNEKISKYGVVYNPLGAEKNKSASSCTECRTLSEIVVKICESYGCVINNFVTLYNSDSADTLLAEVINPLSQTPVDIATSGDIDVSGSGDDSTCLNIPLVDKSWIAKVPKRAIHTCSALDKLALALEKMISRVELTYDKLVLYGRWNGSAYVSSPIADSLDLVMPAGNKLEATGEMETYVKMVKAIAGVQDLTDCPIEDIRVLMREGVKTRILGALDNNDRPIFSELKAMGVDCNNLKIVCAEATPCRSVNHTTNTTTGVVTTDIWVGHKDHYIFGKFEYPPVDMKEVSNDQTNLQVGAIHSVGGKAVTPAAFYKITAEL